MAFSAEDAVLLKQMTDPLLISQITAENLMSFQGLSSSLFPERPWEQDGDI